MLVKTRDGFQHWLSNARRSQLFTTLLAIAGVGAFVGASIVMAPGGDATQVAAQGGTTPASARANAGQAGTGQAAAATGGTSSAGGSAVGTGGGGSAGAAPGSDGGPVAGGVDPGSGEVADVTRVASDRGVTPDSVKLGVLVPNLGAVAATGYSLTDRGDLPQYAQALADYQNKRGGVNGRQISIYTRATDPTNTSDQDAACQAVLNDEKVFGVIDLALSNGPPQQCIAGQGQTPFAHAINWSTDFMDDSGGYDVSYNSAIDRAARTAIRDLLASGWMDSSSVVGVFGENCPTVEPTFEKVVKPLLERYVKKVQLGLIDCTIDAVVSQPPTVATQFRTAGVDRVMVLSQYISAQILISSMARLGASPKYAATDWWTEVTDAGTKNFDADQFDGAVGITSFRSALVNAGQPTYPGIERCDAAASEAGLQPVDSPAAELDQYMCDLFFIMVRGIQDAGPNPTRELWRQAIQAVGPYDSFITGPGSFAPGKTDLPTQVFTAIWHRDCKCWKADGAGFRPMEGSG